MATDSSVAGYLLPDPALAGPPYDQELEDLFHGLLHGLTEIPKELVRPRWQPEPPNQPPFTTNWLAFGITTLTPDQYAYEAVSGVGEGSEEVQRDELIELLISFYGPNSMGIGELLRGGLALAQNRAVLSQAANIDLVRIGDSVRAPALIKDKWVGKTDIRIVFRRRIGRTYKILSLRSGQLHIDAEVTTETIIITD